MMDMAVVPKAAVTVADAPGITVTSLVTSFSLFFLLPGVVPAATNF